jgi:hypothetical protein
MESRRAHEARVLQAVELTNKTAYWNRELQKIDPYVEVVWARPQAHHPALKPGYWHILRRSPVGQPTLIAHEGENGEFRDLDSGIFQTLRDGDMWNSERQRDREKRVRAAEKAEERQAEREREARVEEITARLKSRNGTSVLIPRNL